MAPNDRGLTKSAAAPLSFSLPSFLLSFHACHPPCWSPAPLHFNLGSAPLAWTSVYDNERESGRRDRKEKRNGIIQIQRSDPLSLFSFWIISCAAAPARARRSPSDFPLISSERISTGAGG